MSTHDDMYNPSFMQASTDFSFLIPKKATTSKELDEFMGEEELNQLSTEEDKHNQALGGRDLTLFDHLFIALIHRSTLLGIDIQQAGDDACKRATQLLDIRTEYIKKKLNEP